MPTIIYYTQQLLVCLTVYFKSRIDRYKSIWKVCDSSCFLPETTKTFQKNQGLGPNSSNGFISDRKKTKLVVAA